MDTRPFGTKAGSFAINLGHGSSDIGIAEPFRPNQLRRPTGRPQRNLRLAPDAHSMNVRRVMIIGEDHKPQSMSAVNSRHEIT